MPAKREKKVQENPNALKHLLNQKLVNRISGSIAEVYPQWKSSQMSRVMSELEPLEMKPRVLFIRELLKNHLPQDYPKALKILLKSLKSGKLTGFDLWPYTEFIQTYGLDHLELSLNALKELTVLFTSEWAVRPFIQRYPKETLKYLEDCSQNPNVDIRRWASEGSRPRLPWGDRLQAFIVDPSPALGILENLKFDPELYVRKSVANHLNDISKDHPDLVIRLLSRWKKEADKTQEASIDWIINRSLRTLIKSGRPGALRLLGAGDPLKIKFFDLKMKQKKITIGERIDFEFKICSQTSHPQKLIIDYLIHFVKANKRTAPKVFKLKTTHLNNNKVLHIVKSHSIKKITTREYYSGMHVLEIQINGQIAGKLEWRLEI